MAAPQHPLDTARLDAEGRRLGPDGQPLREAGKGRAGETQWSQVADDERDTPAPKQPNERDESASSQDASSTGGMREVGALARRDAETQVDTDRGPVLDALYNGPVSEGREGGGPPAEKKPQR